MPITRTIIVDDDGSSTTGTIFNNAWKQELYNQIDGLAGVAVVDVPFNAANYTGGWVLTAANQTQLYYARVSNHMLVTWQVGGTMTISGGTQTLYITLPGMPLSTRYACSAVPAVYVDGVAETCIAQVNANDRSVSLQRPLGAVWKIGTFIIYMQGQIMFPCVG